MCSVESSSSTSCWWTACNNPCSCSLITSMRAWDTSNGKASSQELEKHTQFYLTAAVQPSLSAARYCCSFWQKWCLFVSNIHIKLYFGVSLLCKSVTLKQYYDVARTMLWMALSKASVLKMWGFQSMSWDAFSHSAFNYQVYNLTWPLWRISAGVWLRPASPPHRAACDRTWKRPASAGSPAHRCYQSERTRSPGHHI